MSITAFLQHVLFLSWRAVKIGSEFRLSEYQGSRYTLEKTQQEENFIAAAQPDKTNLIHILKLASYWLLFSPGFMPADIITTLGGALSPLFLIH